METFTSINEKIYGIVWGVPMLILLVGCGIYLTIQTRGVAFRRFGFILKNTVLRIFDKPDTSNEGTVSPFEALSTALAATVGTGNIVGVSGAILLGGPGAIFWMWVAALLGMTTKMCEATLAVAYREVDENGEVSGGPMYYISKGLGLPTLGKIFAFFGTFATLGIGNTVQSNSIASTLQDNFGINKWITGFVVAAIAFIVIIGGIKRIGSFTSKMVPLMAAFYIFGALIVLFMHRANLGTAILSIFKGAFSSKAASGGIAGYTIMMALRNGVARGVFTNEAGLGSSPIAHAAAVTDHPARQGLWGVFEVFLDTIVVATITALVILSTGIWHEHDNAASLVAYSFQEGFEAGRYIVTFGLVLFALSTILGWEYYGETCAKYLLGPTFGKMYRFAFIPLIVVGAVADLNAIWLIADNLNGLMAIPNLIGLIGLSGVVIKLTRDFFDDPERIRENEEWRSMAPVKEKSKVKYKPGDVRH
ncbi:MAG: sodium:alanine symporter family protein [Tissierellia bacterium]|nr:sodium:alanine symporter family protein [Tissierellia bacterium]